MFLGGFSSADYINMLSLSISLKIMSCGGFGWQRYSKRVQTAYEQPLIGGKRPISQKAIVFGAIILRYMSRIDLHNPNYSKYAGGIHLELWVLTWVLSLYLVACILQPVFCILYLAACILQLVSCCLYLAACILNNVTKLGLVRSREIGAPELSSHTTDSYRIYSP